MKVNHAGEYAAIRIYGAQILCARILSPGTVEELDELLTHEKQHLRHFRAAMADRSARPCRALWLWSSGGFVLGFFTGILGRAGIWTCTAAVEATVHRHLDEQLSFLQSRDSALHSVVTDVRAEEEEHLSRARAHVPAPSLGARILDAVITGATDAVIWLSTSGDSARLATELKNGRNR